MQEVLGGKANEEEPDIGASLVKKNTQRKAQHHDDAELSKKPNRGDSLDKKNTQRRAVIQESFLEGSNSQRKANAAAKPAYWKMSFEEENVVDQTKYKASEEIKVLPSIKSKISEVVKWSRIVMIPKFNISKMPTRARIKERWVYVLNWILKDADG